MINAFCSLANLPDAELLAELKARATSERHATADLIAVLAEVDERRLYLGEGCSSLFTYCTHVLHLSEHAAYGRIEAARAARRFPIVLEQLAEGAVTLTTVCLLAPHFTNENCEQLLAAAQHKSKREVEHQVAALAPKPPIPTFIRKLPAPAAQREAVQPDSAPSLLAPWSTAPSTREMKAPPAALTRPATLQLLSPERYALRFTLSREGYDKLRRAQDLLRHSIPSGDCAAIVERALTLMVTELEKKKLAATSHPRAERPAPSHSRHVPAAVRRAVWQRDEGQCAFIGPQGRCIERGFLEFHHVIPYADGGATSAANVQLRCRAHNAYEAEQLFGPLLARESSNEDHAPSNSGRNRTIP